MTHATSVDPIALAGRLLSRGGRFYAANLIDSIVKGFRPAEPDKHGGQEKLAEQAHDDNCLVHKRAIFRK